MKHTLTGLIAVAMSLLFSGQQAAPSHPIAPPLSLVDFHGSPFPLSQYKGKVLVLDFWNTKCLLCIKELSTLMTLQNKYRDGIAVVGVAYKDEAASLSGVAGQIKINYPVVLGKANEIQSLYGIHDPPGLVIIGRDGRIYNQHHEYVPEASLEAEAEQLLAGRADREVIGFQAADQGPTTGNPPVKNPEDDAVNAEIAALNPAQAKAFQEDLETANCTCGCKKTFLGCMRSGMKCQLRTAAIQKEMTKIKGN